MDTGNLELILKTISDFSRNKLPLNYKLSCDSKGEFPFSIIKELLSDEVGLHLVFIPEEYGGLGASVYDIYRVSLALAEVDLAIATAFLAISLGMDPLRVGGTQLQKEKWMTAIAEKGLIVAYGVTEPSAGSEVSNIKTTAERIMDEKGKVCAYKLNGTKQFITNGSVADIYSILARAPDGPSFFIVEKGTKGLEFGREEDKHGIRASNTAQVILNDVIVPAENLIGGVEGEGLKHAQKVFGFTRLMVAAFGLGGGVSALKKAIAYSKERVQYGSLLCKKQGYMHRLIVPNVVKLEAARMYIEEIARRLDAGDESLETEGAIAKYFATESGNEAADAAIQAHGGYGYMKEYEVEKIKRDVRITTIYEGTSEIMLNTVGMNRWRSSIQTRFDYYKNISDELGALDFENPDVGARYVSSSARVLNEVLKLAFREKLTRKQFILFKLAEMMIAVETAATVCRKVSQKSNGGNEIDRSLFFEGVSISEINKAISRLHARWAAQIVLNNSSIVVSGTGIFNNGSAEEWRKETGTYLLFDSMEGLEKDMNMISEALSS